jgi:hypothetical protein
VGLAAPASLVAVASTAGAVAEGSPAAGALAVGAAAFGDAQPAISRRINNKGVNKVFICTFISLFSPDRFDCQYTQTR